ncbi:MAG: DUF4342 domain-containing protein [Balneolaceae bacterium]
MKEEKKTISEEIQGTLSEIIGQIKKLIREGNARRVIVKNKKGKILFQSQLTIGAAGATFFVVYAPILSAIATILLLATEVTVIVERFESDDDLNDDYEVDADVIEIKDENEEEDEEDDNEEGKENSGK